MSSWKLVKLNFGRNPVHFGRLGIGMEETAERVQSDTLFSAWVSNYARLFGKAKVEKLLEGFPKYSKPSKNSNSKDLNSKNSNSKDSNQESPAVKISSTFIYRQTQEKTTESKTIYYLPRPMEFPINYPENDLDFFKTYKKQKYLPLEIWRRWYQGEGFTSEDREELIEKTTKKQTDGNLNKSGMFDYGKTHEINKHPKIAVDRITAATNFFHTGLLQFQWENETSGLYFLLNFPQVDPKSEQELEKELKAALELLGEEGLGGERSSGAGRFTIEWFDKLPQLWEKVIKTQGTHHTLISLFWDSPITQDFLENAAYEIQERGGWIGDVNLRRKMVRMFTEGSVFSEQPQGKLVDVTPPQLINDDGTYKFHPVYRSGISLTLPIKIKGIAK